MRRHFIPAIFTKEDSGYAIHFPDLEGVFTEGETMEESYEMCHDAIGLYLWENNGLKEMPNITPIEDIQLEKNEFLVAIEFDEQSYLKKNNSQSVKKTLTIPSWLNEVAIQHNINFSQVLQDSLKKQLNL